MMYGEAIIYRSLRLCSRRLSILRRTGPLLGLTRPLPQPSLGLRVLPGSQSLQRWLGYSPRLFASAADLEQAKERVTTLTEDPGNDIKLKLYALYKQVS